MKGFYTFGEFTLNAEKRTLSSGAGVVHLNEQSMLILLALLRARGAVVSKRKLIDIAWPDSSVGENSLSQCISGLRRALSERPGERRYIITIPSRGYCFGADVEQCAGQSSENPMAVEEGSVPNSPQSVLGWHRQWNLRTLVSAVLLVCATGYVV